MYRGGEPLCIAVHATSSSADAASNCLGRPHPMPPTFSHLDRTLRNKLNEYSGDGVPVPPPGAGEARLAG